MASLLLGTAVIYAAQEKRTPNTGNPSTIDDFKAGDANREAYQRATDIVSALQLSNGDWAADVGAGSGYYAMRLSDVVGRSGKVFAEDISDRAIDWLNKRVKAFGLTNVTVVDGDADSPKLPANALSAVLVVNAYHHFSNHQAMSKQIVRALKPGGRLVIVDYTLAEHRSLSRAEQVNIHEIDPALVRSELTTVGFNVDHSEDPFVRRKPEVKDNGIGRADLWLLVATRPKG
ncbi:MAG TPA: methyltransferase domain-containing protein [Bryobacteraceae bacterium]|nr:methyltransferase domain-containing protein [Bryobacteraceae bacterium]